MRVCIWTFCRDIVSTSPDPLVAPGNQKHTTSLQTHNRKVRQVSPNVESSQMLSGTQCIKIRGVEPGPKTWT